MFVFCFVLIFHLQIPLISIFYDNSADDLITLHIYGLFGLRIVINGRKIWILVYLGELNFSWGNVNAFSMHYLRGLYGYFYFVDYSVDVLDVTVFHYHFRNSAHCSC